MKRKPYRLGELFRVKHGYAFKSEFFDSAGPYVLLTPGNFNEEGGFKDVAEKRKYYTGDIPEGFVLEEGDLLVAMTEQMEGLLGSSAWIPESAKFLHNQRLGRIVDLDESRLDRRYLYYLFNTKGVRHQIAASATGTKVRHTAPERIGRVEVELPATTSQRRIAATLLAYDNLIENNRRRMALLEESARLLYQEWFVRLRFPGHEHTRLVNGVPEGWTKGVVSDFYITASGGTPSRKNPEYFSGEIPWVKTQELPNGFITDTDEKITEDALKKSSAKLFPDRTVLVALYGATVGELGILGMPATTNQACCAVMPLDPRANYIHAYLFFREHKDKLVALSGGAAQNNISQQIIRGYDMTLPEKGLAAAFIEYLSPNFEQWLNLQRQNEKLRSARDLLLPRLMSGEVAV
jgi:type I restriction enzyme S subunit